MIDDKKEPFSLGTGYEERLYGSNAYRASSRTLRESILPPGQYEIVGNILRRKDLPWRKRPEES